MRYQCIRDQASQYPVTVLCHVLQVSPSGYYAWRRRPESARAAANAHLLAEITKAHAASGATYGSPRVTEHLRQRGATCGRHRRAGLAGRPPRAYRVTTDSRHDLPLAENVLDRQFRPTALNQAWVSDLTYLPTQEGWLYLATVMDLGSRRIVGWALDTTLATTLPLAALHMALTARRPAPGLLHHSDRGSQYASAAYQQVLAQHGVIPSMSRKGNCWDNAPMESFFHTLKGEVLQGRTFRTRAEARQAIFQFIECWYNRQRLHSTLGYRSPDQYERAFAA
ncbi:MAG: Integrase core domain protein [bacterium ADurb.Bin429]|nr:MAG: Integrase core domain protein [bacterium ADurb.Bin429]